MSGAITPERVGRGAVHACSFAPTSRGVEDRGIDLVLRGLRKGEPVVWITRERVADRFARAPELLQATNEGQIEGVALGDASVNDAFEPESALALVGAALDRAASNGRGRIRVVQEMNGIANLTPASWGAISQYEEGFDVLLRRVAGTAVCVYDEEIGIDRLLLGMLEFHPWIAWDHELLANPYRVPASAFGLGDASASFKMRLRTIERLQQNEAALRRHSALAAFLLGIRDAVSGAAGTRDALLLALREVTRYAGWPIGVALLPNAEGSHLQPGEIHCMTDPDRIRGVLAILERTRVPRGEGLPGRAWASGTTLWAADLLVDQKKFHNGSGTVDLRATVAVPVTSKGEVLAVLEFFSSETQERDDVLNAVMDLVGAVVGEVVERKRAEKERGLSERRFDALVESAADAVVLCDQEGRVLTWNRAAAELCGYDEAMIVGKSIELLLPERYVDPHRRAMERMLRIGEPTTAGSPMQVHALTLDGREVPVELFLGSWESSGKRLFSFVIRDTTARSVADQHLRLLESALRNVREAIVVTTAKQSSVGATILYVNSAFSAMTGYSESELLGRSLQILTGPKSDPESLARIERQLERGQAGQCEVVAYRKDKTEFLMRWHVSPIREDSGRVSHFVSVQRDVTEERKAAEALQRVDRDALTGLANRELLLKALRRAIERATQRADYRYAVLFLDIDEFKEVNDTHGHLVGDELLTGVARRLERCVRPGDVVARFGGDEFVILLEYVSGVPDVFMVAERVRDQIGRPFPIEGGEIRTSASIGIALCDGRYLDPETVLHDADAAMYQAKESGKSQFQLSAPELYGDLVALFRLEADLRLSVERDEIVIHYQPLVDLGSRMIVGFEALARWQHPERGLVQPDRFIPIAEQSGMIVPIDRWVLLAACKQLAQWQGLFPSSPELVMSVNLSVKELDDPGLVESVRNALTESGISPSSLALEITENVFIERPEAAKEVLTELSATGVQVCIDDFGTGYSSLGYLGRFPVRRLKIDRLFIGRMGRGGDGTIVRAIVDLARNLGLEVLAEGIEDEGQLDELKLMHCELGQGFLFSKPVARHEAEQLLVRQSAMASVL